MSDGLIGHWLDTGEYVRISRLESAKLSHKLGHFDVTWDIGVNLVDLEKEVKKFYKDSGYRVRETTKSKYTFILKYIEIIGEVNDSTQLEANISTHI